MKSLSHNQCLLVVLRGRDVMRFGRNHFQIVVRLRGAAARSTAFGGQVAEKRSTLFLRPRCAFACDDRCRPCPVLRLHPSIFPIADTAATVAFRKGEGASAHVVEQILAENMPDRSD
jgi:hypothetical protein